MRSQRSILVMLRERDDPGVLETVQEAVAEYWPQSPAPRVETAANLEETPDHAGALVITCRACNTREVMHLIDKIRGRYTPGIVLVDPDLPDMGGDGIVTLPINTDAKTIAHTLCGLLSRQPTIDMLRRDLRIAQSSQGGVQLEIERMHEELNLAAQIQRETLPRSMPTMPGVEFGVVFMPAGYVSGDIYDVHPLDEHRVSFFLADAVGHGVPAALLTMIISRVLSAGNTASLTPAEAMTRLNEELVRAQRGRVRFATAIFGVFDTQSGEVTLSCAGHPPPLAFSGGGVETVEADGPLLGVFPGEQYTQSTFHLRRGCTMLLYSDGFETAFPAPGATGDELRRGNRRYIEQLTSLPWPREGEGSLSKTLEQLKDVLAQNAGSLHQPDDVTALAITNVSAGPTDEIVDRAGSSAKAA